MNKKWNALERSWLILAIVLVLSAIIYKHITIVNGLTIFDIASDLSAVFGVIYVICAAKQERRAYLFGIANVILYAIAVYSKGLYISAGYNLLYSFPVMIYGYRYWGKVQNEETSGVKEFNVRQKILGVILMLIAVCGLAMFSETFLGGENVWMDALVSVLVCVATFLLARKYIEQWLLFIIANFMGIILFFPKSLNDMGSIDLFVMWIVYFINSFYGYITWKESLRGESK